MYKNTELWDEYYKKFEDSDVKSNITQKINIGLYISDDSLKDYDEIIASIKAEGFSGGILSLKCPSYNFVIDELDYDTAKDYPYNYFAVCKRGSLPSNNGIYIEYPMNAGKEIISFIENEYIKKTAKISTPSTAILEKNQITDKKISTKEVSLRNNTHISRVIEKNTLNDINLFEYIINVSILCFLISLFSRQNYMTKQLFSLIGCICAVISAIFDRPNLKSAIIFFLFNLLLLIYFINNNVISSYILTIMK